MASPIITIEQGFMTFCKHVASAIDLCDDPFQVTKTFGRAMKFMLPCTPKQHTVFRIPKSDIIDEYMISSDLTDVVLTSILDDSTYMSFRDNYFSFTSLTNGIRGCFELFQYLYYRNIGVKDLVLPRLYVMEKCVKILDYILNKRTDLDNVCFNLSSLDLSS